MRGSTAVGLDRRPAPLKVGADLARSPQLFAREHRATAAGARLETADGAHDRGDTSSHPRRVSRHARMVGR
jgi:hypothetical protein